jgi:hypothetical protein
MGPFRPRHGHKSTLVRSRSPHTASDAPKMTGQMFRAGSHLHRPDQRRCRRKFRGRDSISKESAESFRAGFNSTNREAMQIGEADQEMG